eukprot:scaffold69471_cov28-Tisochrysis_lutea.AAC.2
MAPRWKGANTLKLLSITLSRSLDAIKTFRRLRLTCCASWPTQHALHLHPGTSTPSMTGPSSQRFTTQPSISSSQMMELGGAATHFPPLRGYGMSSHWPALPRLPYCSTRWVAALSYKGFVHKLSLYAPPIQVRGPSPKAAPVSWDKSPVANGAHYFLTAKYDRSNPGVVQE